MGFHRKKQKKNIQNKYSIIFGFNNFILEGTKTISGNMFIPLNRLWACLFYYAIPNFFKHFKSRFNQV